MKNIFALLFIVALSYSCADNASEDNASHDHSAHSHDSDANTEEATKEINAQESGKIKVVKSEPKKVKKKERKIVSSAVKKDAAANSTESVVAIDYEKLGISEESYKDLGKLKIGSQAPNFIARDNKNRSFSLNGAVAEGDVVLIFYRGHWCPYCTKYLGEFVNRFEELQEKGVQVVAVAPEGSKYQRELADEFAVDIPFISDPKGEIMKLYKVAFTVNDQYNEKFAKWKDGKSLASVNGQDEAMLPIPATYLIGADRKIKYAYFNPDYSKRPDIDQIINKL